MSVPYFQITGKNAVDVVNLLEDLQEYFDQRADAEYFPGSPRPIANEEMGHLVKIRALLHSITGETA